MYITVEIKVTVHRTDGSITAIDETIETKPGDNPRFEQTEIIKAVSYAEAKLYSRFGVNVSEVEA